MAEWSEGNINALYPAQSYQRMFARDRYNVTRATAYLPTPVLWLRVGTVYDRPRNGLLIARIGSRPITQPSGQKLNNGLHLPIVVETLEGTWTHHSLLDIDVVNVFYFAVQLIRVVTVFNICATLTLNCTIAI